MCNVYPIFRDLRQFLLIVTLTSGPLPSNLQLYTSSFGFTCRFYKVFGRYPFCCVRIGLDWIQNSGSSAGLDWIRISGSWIRIGLDRFNSIHSILWFANARISQTPCNKYISIAYISAMSNCRGSALPVVLRMCGERGEWGVQSLVFSQDNAACFPSNRHEILCSLC